MATDRAPLVSVNVPCYRQLHHAQRAIASILDQTFEDFELTLFDDGASDEYEAYVRSLGDPRVHYHRNAVRLGAMQNMFSAIRQGRGRYSLVFHEDDLLGRGYLAAAVDVLERDPRCGFVAATIHEFRDDPPASALNEGDAPLSVLRCGTGAEFLRGIFRGVEPMFGTVVYRRTALDGVEPRHDAFATLVDRPFLLSILERWACAIVTAPTMGWYRAHDDTGRHRAMTPEHILRLFETYRLCFPAQIDQADRDLFYAYSSYWLFTLFDLTAGHEPGALRRFAYQAWRRGLYDPRWGRAYGRKRLLTRMLRPSGSRA